MNDIVNGKKGHNIVNDNRFVICHTAYLFLKLMYPLLYIDTLLFIK